MPAPEFSLVCRGSGLPLLVLAFVGTIWGIVDAAQRKQTGWLIGIIVGWVVGLGWLIGWIYLLAIRPKLVDLTARSSSHGDEAHDPAKLKAEIADLKKELDSTARTGSHGDEAHDPRSGPAR